MTEDPPPDDDPTGDGPVRRPVWSWALAVLTAAPYLIGSFGRWWWAAELFTHFRLQCLALTAAAAVPLALGRRWKPLGLCAVAGLLYAAPLLGAIGAPGFQPSKAGGLTVVTANVLTSNRNPAPLLAYLARVDPDVICLQEIDARWAADLAPLHARYPHRHVVPRPDNFGMAVLSRHPATFQEFHRNRVTTIRAAVSTPRGGLAVWNVHTPPPAGHARAAARDAQLRFVGDLSKSDRVLVCGDLNCTPFSPMFDQLLFRGKLTDPRGGGYFPATWHVGRPTAIPIDHLLPGGGAWLTGLAAGPDVGSDHRPLFGRVHFFE